MDFFTAAEYSPSHQGTVRTRTGGAPEENTIARPRGSVARACTVKVLEEPSERE